MIPKDKYTLDFTHPPKEKTVLEYDLQHSFFAAIEGSEITDGNVALQLTITPLPNRLYQLSLSYKGEVVVVCDRCLEPLTLPIQVEDELQVKLDTYFDDENDELIILDMQLPIYDFTWIFYELLALHLPIQRMHKREDCNPEMLKYLVNELPEDAEEIDLRPKDDE